MSIFTKIKKQKPKRSTFDLSHDVKLSLDMGDLVPFLLQEVVPGDKFTMSNSAMIKFAPMIAPVMHKIGVYMEYFFVPNRILWHEWETWITGSRNGKQLTAQEMPAFPTVYYYDRAFIKYQMSGELGDYLGMPTPNFHEHEPDYNPYGENLVGRSRLDIPINLIPFAGYQKIYDEYYRSQDLTESIYDREPQLFDNYDSLKSQNYTYADSPMALLELQRSAWKHDYFTSALPFAQKGEAVTLPFQLDDLYAEGGAVVSYTTDTLDPVKVYGDKDYRDDYYLTKSPAHNLVLAHAGAPYDASRAHIDNSGNLRIDDLVIKSSQGVNTIMPTINDLRAAVRLQEFLETNARGGTRYFEQLRAHFGISSPDSRLQRPEFIGSHRSNVIISEVLQTTQPQNEYDTPVGTQSGHGASASRSKKFTYYAQEHGYIFGLMRVLPYTAYQQGIPKHFEKIENRLQYYFPEFAHLGEQEIKNREIMIPWRGYYGDASRYNSDMLEYINDTFGYIPRYAEYKYQNSRVAGDFRNTLDFWHLGRIFDSDWTGSTQDLPNLNDAFIKVDKHAQKRIFAVEGLPASDTTDESKIRSFHSLYAHVFNIIKASRLMPKYGTPTL